MSDCWDSGSSSSIPLEKKDLTPDWLERALNITIKPNSLKWTDDLTNDGVPRNVLGLEFETTEGEVHQLIVKLEKKCLESCDLHLAEGKNLVTKNVFMNEFYFYRRILPDILETMPQLATYLCQVQEGIKPEGDSVSNGHPSVLLLQDLRTLGYKSKPFHEQMDYMDFDQGIVFLAKFHFATTSVEREKNKSLPQLYPWLLTRPPGSSSEEETPNPKTPEINGILNEACFSLGLSNLETFLPETHRHAFVDLKRNAGKILRLVLAAGQEYPTGIHGALWQNNILVYTDSTSNLNKKLPDLEEDEMSKVKVIDWQLMGYADPLFDLAIYILSSFPEEHLSIMSVELTVLRYTEEFNKHLKERGYEVKGQTKVEEDTVVKLLEFEVRKTSKIPTTETTEEVKKNKSQTDVLDDGGSKVKVRTDFHENLQFFNTYGLAYAFIWFTIYSKSILNLGQTSEQNEQRLVNIFKFLHDDMDLPAFLYSIL